MKLSSTGKSLQSRNWGKVLKKNWTAVVAVVIILVLAGYSGVQYAQSRGFAFSIKRQAENTCYFKADVVSRLATTNGRERDSYSVPELKLKMDARGVETNKDDGSLMYLSRGTFSFEQKYWDNTSIRIKVNTSSDNKVLENSTNPAKDSLVLSCVSTASYVDVTGLVETYSGNKVVKSERATYRFLFTRTPYTRALELSDVRLKGPDNTWPSQLITKFVTEYSKVTMQYNGYNTRKLAETCKKVDERGVETAAQQPYYFSFDTSYTYSRTKEGYAIVPNNSDGTLAFTVSSKETCLGMSKFTTDYLPSFRLLNSKGETMYVSNTQDVKVLPEKADFKVRLATITNLVPGTYTISFANGLGDMIETPMDKLAVQVVDGNNYSPPPR